MIQITGQARRGKHEWAARRPPEKADGYPDADMFGILPAAGFYLRHARHLIFNNMELAMRQPDARPAFWCDEVDGLELFRIRLPEGMPACAQSNTRHFGVFRCTGEVDR